MFLLFLRLVTENLKKLTRSGSDDLGLGCVNGIKAIAMLLIIAGHSLVFLIGGPVQNTEFFEKVKMEGSAVEVKGNP